MLVPSRDGIGVTSTNDVGAGRMVCFVAVGDDPLTVVRRIIGSMKPLSRNAKRWTHWALCNFWILFCCKAIISSVAAFDIYLTIKYVSFLNVYERNPLGRWLMALDNGPEVETQQIAAFITVKFLGTILVILIIHGLASWRVDLAGLVAVSIAIFQLGLVYYLLFAYG